MKALTLSLLVLFLIGCGAGSNSSSSSSDSGSSTGSTSGTVHAASYTNANLSGSFAFGIAGTSGSAGEVGTGVVVADGQGNITSGDETVSTYGVSCHATFSGNYSITADGTGTATVNVSPDSASVAKGCLSGQATFTLAIGNSGSSLVLASQGPLGVFLATGIKQ